MSKYLICIWAFVLLYLLECRAVAQLSKPGQGQGWAYSLEGFVARLWLFTFHCETALHMLLLLSCLVLACSVARFIQEPSRCECDTAARDDGRNRFSDSDVRPRRRPSTDWYTARNDQCESRCRYGSGGMVSPIDHGYWT